MLERFTRVNMGLPKSRETHGDGVAIVVREREQVTVYMAKCHREHR
jgi:hypothetical protein